jgi:serine/threonine-protein kinase
VSDDRWQILEEIYHGALEREPNLRAAFLDEACAGDLELRRKVAALLAYDDKAANFIEAPALEIAAKTLVGEQLSEERTKPTQIGLYDVLTPLGSGGMGEVYLATDPRLRRKVAIKLLPSALSNDPERLRRFEQEAHAASALNHPNIITIYEIGQSNGRHYLVTEYIEGETLRERIAARSIDVIEVVEIAAQVASALTAAHAAGITHRDIKPENLMLRPDGLVKVLDFGLAKFEQRSSSDSKEAAIASRLSTAPGIVMGTVTYMSPEQAKGIRVDSRTDLWSMGVVLYEMVTGDPPFAGETSTETISLILQKEPAPLTRAGGKVHSELTSIVAKTLTKNLEGRYQTAEDVLFDLRNLKRKLEEDPEERTVKPESNANCSISTSSARSNPFESNSAAAKSLDTLPLSRAEYIDGGVRRYYRMGLAIAALLIVAAIAIGGYLYLRPIPVAINSIAVLPFDNQSHDPDSEYLSDGMTESVINSLTQLPDLKVIARSSVFRYKQKETDPIKTGQELGVSAVVIGRLLRRGDNLRISVELVDVRNKRQLWGEQYERKFADMMSLQREITREISRSLRPKLSGTERTRTDNQATVNSEAYQLYLKGRFYWNKRTGEGVTKAIDYFEQSIENDPNNALAYAGLADAYGLQTTLSDTLPQESFPKTKAAARRALELDETLAEAHTSLAAALFHYDRNFPESEREFQRAIELNANYATAHHWYGAIYLAKMGRFDEAIAQLKRAQELDPLSLIINADLGNTYIQARQYDKAIQQLRNTIEMDQNFYFAQWLLGMAYEMKGSPRDATLAYQRASQLNDDPWVLSLLAHVSVSSGQRGGALKLLNQLKQISKQRYVSAYGFAVVYAALNEKDQAFQWLEKSYENREPRITRLKVDPLLDNLRSDPRCSDLQRRMGLPQ